MRDTYLVQLEVENFRSINDKVTVRLDAPVVLIHGNNGVGKTSLLSAIELALTGGVPSLGRVDPTYQLQLLHYGATKGEITLLLEQPDAEMSKMHVSLGKAGPTCRGQLEPKLAQFFSERCYLAQSSLSQLLTIYQQSGSDAASPLARFVNELLGLDQLEALEKGLEASADIRNARKLVPTYLAIGSEQARLQADVASRQAHSDNLNAIRQSAFARLEETTARLVTFGIEVSASDPALMEKLGVREDQQNLYKLTDVERQLVSAQNAYVRLQAIRASSQREVLEFQLAQAEALLAQWRELEGKEILSLYADAEELLLPTSSSKGADIAANLEDLLNRWQLECSRIQKLIADDQVASSRHKAIQDEHQVNESRLANYASQMALASADVSGLSKSLAAVLPHIHGPDCPICQRNFREVSTVPLTDFVAKRIVDLGNMAERLGQLSQSRAVAERKKVELERERMAVEATILDSQERLRLQNLIAKIQILLARGGRLQAAAGRGSALTESNTVARRSMEQLSSTDSEERALRAAINEQAQLLSFGVEWTVETLESALTKLLATTRDLIEHSKETIALKDTGRRLLEELARAIADSNQSTTELQATKLNLEKVNRAHREAEADRSSARQVLRAVRRARGAVVSKVFNDRLNRVWRDLFVRLAPREAFVPSFFLPADGDVRSVTPSLRTIHRSGATGGAPGAMLSAGNLNTAALTLFLALHLSVEAKLPCLVLDDPVQSMDEVHIAQFAALLRTLSKEHERQIFIAVHDRPLFDYLSLELSPAFEGDELITIEVGSSSEGRTRCTTSRKGYKADIAIVASAA